MKPTVLCVMGCIFNNKGEMLLAKRNDLENSKWHKKWQLPGGGVDRGETFEETLIREVEEETGLKVIPLSKRPAVTYEIIDTEEYPPGVRIILLAYPCKIIGGKLGENVDKETAKLRWFKAKDIPWSETLPGNRELIRQLARDFLKKL